MILKEIIVNAGELEKRVATLENGRLMELDVEREPNIVGNIYKAKVTKVLKGMDAAFLEIGTDKNAFIAASDAAPELDDEDHRNRVIPPITDLLRAGQEILVQVIRAPLGSKGARVTTHISFPGRYTVLMLNSGSHVGVSRKITNINERRRLKDIANSIIKEPYSLIIRTEAEGKDEVELRQDMELLLDIAEKVSKQSKKMREVGLIHDDMTLVYRLIRDDFSRDVSRLVIDNEDVYNDIMELLGNIAPEMAEKVVLYTDSLPIFHAYNIEQEIERTLRRKVWLPSGGSLVIDQAEALTAIDVNTSKFIGQVELAETAFTTNLQAAKEVARQLRLRDLGGIIVVDFIDMDNIEYKQEVLRTFDEALKRDRAKIKIHQISSLGLVEMTRKRTGESLTSMLTTPCPYCSGIGRVQNTLTMALRIERELARAAVIFPETESYMITAHPRVIATMLGNNGEAHRDLEEYLGRPVYLRLQENYHPNVYNIERLTLEQALTITTNLEEGKTYEAKIITNDPTISYMPLAIIDNIFITVNNLNAPVGAKVKVKIIKSGTSYAVSEPLSKLDSTIIMENIIPESEPSDTYGIDMLPEYIREERSDTPPASFALISPTASGLGLFAKESVQNSRYFKQYLSDELKRSSKKNQRKERTKLLGEHEEVVPIQIGFDENNNEEIVNTETGVVTEITAGEHIDPTSPQRESSSARRRRRRRNKVKALQAIEELKQATEPKGERPIDLLPVENEKFVRPIDKTKPTETTTNDERPTRTRGRRRHSAAAETQVAINIEAKTEETAVSEPTTKTTSRRGRKPRIETAKESVQGQLPIIETAKPEIAIEPIVENIDDGKPKPTRQRRAKKSDNAQSVIENAVVETSAADIENKPKTPVRRTPRRQPKNIQNEAAANEKPAVIIEEKTAPVEVKKPIVRRGRKPKDEFANTSSIPVENPIPTPPAEEKIVKPVRTRRTKAKTEVAVKIAEPVTDEKPKTPARRGRRPKTEQ